MKMIRNFLLGGLASMLLMLGASLIFLQATPEEWAKEVRLGFIHYRLSIPVLLRLASHPRVIHFLDGHEVETEWGRMIFHEDAPGVLLLSCRPCRIDSRAISRTALELPDVSLSLRRQGDALNGEWRSGASLRMPWTAQLQDSGLIMKMHLPETGIRNVYALFATVIPEYDRAVIAGTVELDAEVHLPSRLLILNPVVKGFSVQGLGTEVLRSRLPFVQCPGALHNDVPAFDALGRSFGKWLPRAVIAAEDQRFYQHPGFDVREITASLRRNQNQQGIARGGSTLDQQLAKLLFTGSEQSHIRKLRELLYAVEMEKTLGKARILQVYLAIAPWGQGVCGAGMAAQAYYGKPVEALNRAEAAWLAAMLHTPDREFLRWKSRGHPDVKRGSWVVNAMGGARKSQERAVLMLATLAPPPAL